MKRFIGHEMVFCNIALYCIYSSYLRTNDTTGSITMNSCVCRVRVGLINILVSLLSNENGLVRRGEGRQSRSVSLSWFRILVDGRPSYFRGLLGRRGGLGQRPASACKLTSSTLSLWPPFFPGNRARSRLGEWRWFAVGNCTMSSLLAQCGIAIFM